MSWVDLRDIINHIAPTQDSAVFRTIHPKSWWWTADIDFAAALLYAVQVGNWQRAGGGQRPKPIKRPEDKPVKRRARGQGLEPTSPADLAERRQRMKRHLETSRKGGGG